MTWLAKPRPGTPCDTYFGGWDVSARYPAGGNRCPNRAVETVLSSNDVSLPAARQVPMWLCASCVVEQSAKGWVVRNPRLYPVG